MLVLPDIANAIRLQFSEDELEQAVGRLDRNYEDFVSAKGTYEENSNSLLRAAKRQGWLSELFEQLKKERSEAKFQKLMLEALEALSKEAQQPFAIAVVSSNFDIKALTTLVLNFAAFGTAWYFLEDVFDVPRPWSLAIACLVFLAFGLIYFVPAWLRAKAAIKRRQLGVGGQLKDPQYFRLTPYAERDASKFHRADRAEETIVQWLINSSEPILYLYGQSGVGKSSLLNASVIPRLRKSSPRWLSVIVRLGPDPQDILKNALLASDVAGDEPSQLKMLSLETLLERAAHQAQQQDERILFIIDQFEEFFILLDENERRSWLDLLRAIPAFSKGRMTLLLSLRAEYLADLSSLDLPYPTIGVNCEVVRPFSQAAAKEFLANSGLVLNETLVEEVISEAAEIEELPDRIRAVVINMLGMVLASFKGVLPKGINPQRLLLGYVERVILEPTVRELAPSILRSMTTSMGTKRLRTLGAIAAETKISIIDARGCLIRLGQEGLVRVFAKTPLANEQWEFSHDFVARLVQPLVQTWRETAWTRLKPWLAPLSIAVWLVLICVPLFVAPRIKDAVAVAALTRGGFAESASTKSQFTYIGDVSKESRDSDISPKAFYDALQYFDWIDGSGSLSIDRGRVFTGFNDNWPVLTKLSSLSVALNDGAAGFQLDKMPAFPLLERLTLSRFNGSFKGMPMLPTLRELHLVDSVVRNFDGIPTFPALSWLSLQGSVESLSGMPTFPALRYLTLTNTNLIPLQSLPAFPLLEELNINIRGRSDLAGMPKFPSLKRLTLDCGWGENEAAPKEQDSANSLDGLPEMPELEMLYVGCASKNAIRNLRGLQHLKTLTIKSSEAEDLLDFPQLPELEKLWLIGEKWNHVEQLPTQPKLVFLSLAQAKNAKSLASLSQQPSLKMLDLSDETPISDYSFPNWMRLKHISGNVKSEKDLDTLAQIGPELESAVLKVRSISDLKPLVSLKSLREVKIEVPVAEVKDVDTASLGQLSSFAKVSITAPSEICRRLENAGLKQISCEFL